jgi:hypothetical protein
MHQLRNSSKKAYTELVEVLRNSPNEGSLKTKNLCIIPGSSISINRLDNMERAD